MPRATTTIPFHALRFEDDLPTLHEVERRLKTVLRGLRRHRQAAQTGDDDDGRDKLDQFFDHLNEAERRKIRRRAHRYVQRLDALSGLSHLSEENRAKLTPLHRGLPGVRFGAAAFVFDRDGAWRRSVQTDHVNHTEQVVACAGISTFRRVSTGPRRLPPPASGRSCSGRLTAAKTFSAARRAIWISAH